MGGFLMDIMDIQPSQLYISQSKLQHVYEWFDPEELILFEPIPIKKLNGKIIFTDGHTRAYAAYMAGMKQLLVCWDADDLDWEAYQKCVDQCNLEHIYNISDMHNRVVNDEQYKLLWNDWCDKMHEELAQQRGCLKII